MPNYLITLQTLTNRGFYSIDLTNIIKREREREREREWRRLVYASGFFQLKINWKKNSRMTNLGLYTHYLLRAFSMGEQKNNKFFSFFFWFYSFNKRAKMTFM